MPHVLAAEFDKCRDRFPGAAPFGADVKYEPVFENLKAEVLKLTAHSSLEGGVDWKSVKAWSLEILTTKSKDLTVGCYLALSLFVLDGYGGLSDGIALLQKYLQEDWDGMFPPAARPRNRVSTLEWLLTRLPPFIETKAPEPFEVALLAPLREQLAAFQENVKQRLAHETPSFSDLTAALAAYGGEAAAPPPAAESPSSAAGSPAPPAAVQAPAAAPRPAAEPAVAPGTPADEIAGRIRALIPALREADLSSPVPYRLLRSLKWDTVAALPVLDPNASTPGTTRIQPPRPQQRATLETPFAAGNWSALLNASEAAFQDGIGTFWLDLQRYTVLALEGLGSSRAAEAVKEEVARFLARFESLPTFYFAERTVTDPKRPAERTIERTPFASEETRQWLETLKGTTKGGEEAPTIFLPAARAVESAEPSLSPADSRAAQDLLAKQQPATAFDLLQAAVEKAPNQRSRFRTRLAAARLCYQANQAAWARALLETLLEESERFHFEDWEPETATDLYQLLALCYSRPAKKGGPQDPEAARAQIETLRRKLFRLDLRAAAALEEALKR
ncbi:MAG TPA: type VI secretion system protein TssA [Thermoanaerobaculia bacterium]|nr:type VI secretion system protein TssA [Thermoanaerobaculia bacterium]